MSWIRRHPALSLFLLALALRASLAALTEFAPLMPEYYFTDAAYSDELARDVLRAWTEGRGFVPPVSPAKRIHAVGLAFFYSIAGFHPLAAKLANAAFGAAAVLLLHQFVLLIFGPRRAFLAALLVALWPSHVFMTSQNFKDGPVLLCAFAALWALLSAMRAGTPALAARWSAAGLGLLLLVGLQRSYLMAVLAAAAAAAGVLAAAAAVRRGEPFVRHLLCLAAAAAAPLLYRPMAAALFSGPLRMTVAAAPGDAGAGADGAAAGSPETAPGASGWTWTPRRLSDMRREQQVSDQAWAQIYKGRRIGTQLFPGAEFRSWWDVAAFLPKGAFYALFQPLPGLYPMEGNPGRMLASLENLALLALALAALAGFLAGPKPPERLLLLLVFAMMTAGAALLEFDLGSATRHKLLFAPLLFPFALSLIEERRLPREGRRRVLQILECGGPGGTGNQVAAICNGLDPAAFDQSLAFSVRDGRPDEYRAQAAGAARAFFIPEMTREISPARDLAALGRLLRVLEAEAPDVVHTHSSKAGALGRLAAWLSGAPLVFHSPRGYGFLQQDRSGRSRLVYRLAERAASWIGEIVAISPSEAALARELSWGKAVHSVPDPFLGKVREPAHASGPGPAPAPGKGVLAAACGRLTYARNPEAFLRLAKAASGKRPSARFLWVGGGESEQSFRASAKEAGLEGSLELTGWLEPLEAVERLSTASIFVHFSRWEGLPNAVLEAMALGLPVVASAVPGNRDAVLDGETGFIVRDEDELLAAVLRLADDPALRRKLGLAGRERVLRDFTPAATFAALSKLYAGPPQA